MRLKSSVAIGHVLCDVSVIFLLVMPLFARAAPDAGSVLQQVESRQGAPLDPSKLRKPLLPTASQAQEGGGGAVVRVNAFRIEGARLVDEQILQAALAGFPGKDLSLMQLQEAAWVLVLTYREAGWLVDAFLPQQEIDQGVVTLRVVEARLGNVRVDIQPGVRIGEEQIRNMVNAQIKPGEPVRLARVDRALLLIDDLAGVTAKGAFMHNDVEGLTDLVIAVTAGKTVDTAITIDNYGARSTGQHRVSTELHVNSILGMGDSLKFNLIKSEESIYHRAAFSVPIGFQGLRVGAYGSDMTYAFLWNGIAPIAGFARTFGGSISGSLVRTPASNWTWNFSTERKHLQNQSNDVVTSDYLVQAERGVIQGAWQDEWAGLAHNSLSVTLTNGRVNNPTDTSGTQGHFSKLNLSFNREQGLTERLSWYLQAQTQSADKNLDSSEKMYLGGPFGVRAYPVSEAGGAAGYAMTTGLRQRLEQGWTLTGFADWGRIAVCRSMPQLCLKNNESNAQALKGLGASIQWQNKAGLDVTATWSRRHGSNPSADLTGLDIDKTRVINRLWLSAALRF